MACVEIFHIWTGGPAVKSDNPRFGTPYYNGLVGNLVMLDCTWKLAVLEQYRTPVPVPGDAGVNDLWNQASFLLLAYKAVVCTNTTEDPLPPTTMLKHRLSGKLQTTRLNPCEAESISSSSSLSQVRETNACARGAMCRARVGNFTRPPRSRCDQAHLVILASLEVVSVARRGQNWDMHSPISFAGYPLYEACSIENHRTHIISHTYEEYVNQITFQPRRKCGSGSITGII